MTLGERVAAASMRASRSSTIRITVEPVPSSWRGTAANARRRSATSGVEANTRARSMLPPAESAASRAASAATPVAQPLLDVARLDRPELDSCAARRDRDQVVRYEVGEDQERRRRWRLLDRLQQDRRALRREQGTRRGSSPCGHPRSGPARRGGRSQAPAEQDRGADPGDLAHVWVLAAQRELGGALCGVVAPEQQRREGPRRLFLVEPAGPTKR